jgi:hypothetical protein
MGGSVISLLPPPLVVIARSDNKKFQDFDVLSRNGRAGQRGGPVLPSRRSWQENYRRCTSCKKADNWWMVDDGPSVQGEP